MSEISMMDCSLTEDSSMKKAGKVICGSCILIAMAVPVVMVLLVMLAKFLGYI